MRLRSWEAVDLFSEMVDILKAARAAFEGSEDFSRFNSVLGTITASLGWHQIHVYQHAEARENLEEAIHLLENNPSGLERALAPLLLAWMYYEQGKMQRSAELLKQSLAGFQEERNAWWYLTGTVNLALVYVLSGNLSEAEALCQEASRLVAPGDLHTGLLLLRAEGYLHYFKNDYGKAEQLMQENLQGAYQYNHHRGVIAMLLADLCQVTLATNQVDAAERYAQESINIVSEYGLFDLAFATLCVGKCFVARSEVEAGRDKFRQVIKLGQRFDAFYLVYWAMVNIARTYLVEGQTEKALEMALLLKDCSVEYKLAQDDGNRLIADLQAMLSREQAEVVKKQGDGEISVDQAAVVALAYALEHE
jgi:tetratricopeptide (TPR) repeat protein